MKKTKKSKKKGKGIFANMGPSQKGAFLRGFKEQGVNPYKQNFGHQAYYNRGIIFAKKYKKLVIELTLFDVK